MDQATERRRALITGILSRLPASQQRAIAEALRAFADACGRDTRQPVAGRSGRGGPGDAAARPAGPVMTGQQCQRWRTRAARWPGTASGALRDSRGGLFALALAVGGGAGLGAVAFRYLIVGFTWLATGHAAFGQQG